MDYCWAGGLAGARVSSMAGKKMRSWLKIAVSWSISTVEWMANCWAERMVAARVSSRAGQTAAEKAV